MSTFQNISSGSIMLKYEIFTIKKVIKQTFLTLVKNYNIEVTKMPDDGETRTTFCLQCKVSTTHIFHKGFDRHFWKCQGCGREK